MIILTLSNRKRWAVSVTAFFLAGLAWPLPEAGAVVGRAEEFDRFRREGLEEFQEKLLVEETKSPEERRREEARAIQAQELIEGKKRAIEKAPKEEQKELKEELKKLEKELLRIPRRDRFRFGGDFDMTYDNNIDRKVIRQEEGETTFRLNPWMGFDLGGRKTDLRFETRFGRELNVKRAENNLTTMEGRFRFGRKIMPKTMFSMNDRVSRESKRTIDMDDKRIRWDNAHRGALNYAFSPKLSVNLEADYTRRDFPHENFDQDSDYQLTLDPNLFFQATPKTRFSLGYKWGFSRIRTEASDTTTHDVRAGYFGKITGKSSASVDMGWNHQDPDSAQAAKSDKVTGSLGYIWQTTPKSSFRFLFSRSLQNSTSDKVGTGELIQTDSFFVADTLSLSFRHRLNRKISTEFSFDGAHSRSKVSTDDDPKTETRQWTFPFQAAIDYAITQWFRIRLTYTYRHRIGDEEADQYRSHTWFVGTNFSF